MTASYTQIDLSQLPAPEVVEPLDYETIRQAMIDDFRSRDAEFDAILESDPAIKVLEAAAYREMLVRQRVNDAARARMLAFATGPDLDHIAARFSLAREEGESDARLRRRVQMVPETYTAAGTPGAYVWHAFDASPEVADVAVASPAPGRVEVSVLGMGEGHLDRAALAAIRARIESPEVKPLTDGVVVRQATLVPYTVTARLWLYRGPDAEVVRRQAEASLRDHAATLRRIGHDVTLSGLYAALHVSGVQEVVLDAPTTSLEVDLRSCAILAGVDIRVVGRDA